MNEYKITLDKERTLKYSNRSFHELEKHTGKSILSIISLLSNEETKQQALDKFFSTKFLTDFIWAGLLHEKLSYEQVIDIIPVNKYVEIMTFAMNVIVSEFGISTTETEKKNQTVPGPETSQT